MNINCCTCLPEGTLISQVQSIGSPGCPIGKSSEEMVPTEPAMSMYFLHTANEKNAKVWNHDTM